MSVYMCINTNLHTRHRETICSRQIGYPESSQLAQEITGRQLLDYEMSRKLDVLKQRQADARFARTVAGSMFNWGGSSWCTASTTYSTYVPSSTIPRAATGFKCAAVVDCQSGATLLSAHTGW